MIYYSITHYYYSILNINRQTKNKGKHTCALPLGGESYKTEQQQSSEAFGSMELSYINTTVCFYSCNC